MSTFGSFCISSILRSAAIISQGYQNHNTWTKLPNMLSKKQRRHIVTPLFASPIELSRNNRFSGATVNASTTVNASGLINHILGIALGNNTHGTLINACTAADALIGDGIRHGKHLHNKY